MIQKYASCKQQNKYEFISFKANFSEERLREIKREHKQDSHELKQIDQLVHPI